MIYKLQFWNLIGKLSFLPKSQSRPVTPSDLNLNPEQEKLVINIVLDGQILKENLNYTGNDELWLQKELVSQGFNSVNDIFLATCDSNNNLSIYPKKNFTNNNSHDIFG